MRSGFGGEARLLKLSAGARLRREHFGGLLFDRATGTTVDLDAQAFAMLAEIQVRGVALEDSLGPACQEHPAESRVQREVIDRLLELGVLACASLDDAVAAAGQPTPLQRCRPEDGPPPSGVLTAPETIH